MTVSYMYDVSSTGFLNFSKLLLRWRGSVWKMIWHELLAWLTCYFLIAMIYRTMLDNSQRIIFEDVVVYCTRFADQIPLTFMLGFYVQLVVNRWSEMYKNIGWIDIPVFYVTACIPGLDETSRIIRRTCVRYMVLTQTLVYRDISVRVRKRFPNMDSLVGAGLLTEREKCLMNQISSKHKNNFLPCLWLMRMLNDARNRRLICSNFHIHDLFNKMTEYRLAISNLARTDWVPVPMVYTQVMFIAVRCYFLIAIVAKQYVSDSQHVAINSTIDLYFPLLTVVQFIFYVGWMKVAEALLNPFGEDDDDFETNFLIDRNLQVLSIEVILFFSSFQLGYTMVDTAMKEESSFPPLEKDLFWADDHPEPLYSKETANIPIHPLIGSAEVADYDPIQQIEMVKRTVPIVDASTHARSIYNRRRRTTLRRSFKTVRSGIARIVNNNGFQQKNADDVPRMSNGVDDERYRRRNRADSEKINTHNDISTIENGTIHHRSSTPTMPRRINDNNTIVDVDNVYSSSANHEFETNNDQSSSQIDEKNVVTALDNIAEEQEEDEEDDVDDEKK